MKQWFSDTGQRAVQDVTLKEGKASGPGVSRLHPRQGQRPGCLGQSGLQDPQQDALREPELRRTLHEGNHGAGGLEDPPHVRPRPALHTPPPTLARARTAASMRGAALCGAQQMSMRGVKAPPKR